MPGDVTDFLQHVHAEKAKKPKNANTVNAHDQQQFDSDDGDDEQLYYYETANELNAILSQQDRHPWERRHKRMYKDNYLFNYIIDLPIGEHSSNWFLVTNDNIGNDNIKYEERKKEKRNIYICKMYLLLVVPVTHLPSKSIDYYDIFWLLFSFSNYLTFSRLRT